VPSECLVTDLGGPRVYSVLLGGRRKDAGRWHESDARARGALPVAPLRNDERTSENIFTLSNQTSQAAQIHFGEPQRSLGGYPTTRSLMLLKCKGTRYG
jgi:hypothetical protein